MSQDEVTDRYVDRVLSGDRLAGRQEIRAVERYLRDLDDDRFYFDFAAADFACLFFELMQVTQGELAGESFCLRPWQRFIVRNIAGFKWAETGKRRYRDALIQVARGNGKTPLGAGLTLWAGGFDPECPQRAESYVAATKRRQAKIGFDDLVAFLNSAPDLKKRAKIMTHDVEILHNKSRFEYLSSDGNVSDGLRIQALLRDELHAWQNTQRSFDERLTTGLGKFAQTLCVTTTTAGSDESHIWIENDNIARQILDVNSGVDIESQFVFIAEMDEDDDLYDIENYHKSNPMLEYGIVKREHIERMIERASASPDKRAELERFHANRRVRSSEKLISTKAWAACGDETVDHGSVVPHAGVDLGFKDDLAAIGYCWHLEGDIFKVETDIFVPQGGRRDLSREPWRSWIREGWLTVTDSEWTDTEPMYDALRLRIERHGLATIAYDPWNAMEFATNCVNELGANTYAFAQQKKKFHEPCSAFIQAVSEGRIRHGGNPVLRWCVSNVVFASDVAGHRQPDKLRSDDKIDPLVAVIMALSECLFAEKPKKSRYETETPTYYEVDDKGGVTEHDVGEAEPLLW